MLHNFKIMNLIDTHAHLYLKDFSEDIDLVIRRAKEQGIKKILLPNIDVNTVKLMLNCCDKYPGICYPMIGLHPTSVNKNWEEELYTIKKLFENHYFCGVGETGIDLYWDKTFYNEQVNSFIEHIKIALKYSVPIIIHSRNSIEQILEILSDYKNINGILHCFSGNIEQAIKATEEMGLKLGIGGVITYKNSMLKKIVEVIPIQHLVLETDAPYLTPIPYRGKRNESSFLPLILNEIAMIKKISYQEAAEIIFINTNNLFKNFL